MCVGPQPTPTPQRVCEPANGTCLDIQPAGPTPTASASALVPATVHEAYDLLLDHFVDPLESGALLESVLRAVNSEVVRISGTSPVPGERLSPSFAGDRATDWSAFTERYQALVAEVPASFAADCADTAIQAMAQYANDGHTTYLNARAYEQYRSWLQGNLQYAGIGVRLAGSPPTVYEVFRNSPAERAGLEFGDQIAATEGRTTSGVPLDQVVNWIRGQPGTAVRLTVARPGGSDSDLVVVRARVEVASTESYMLDHGIGYIHVRGFPDPGVTDRLVGVLEDFRAQRATGLIVDLRGNSGGRIDVGLDSLSLFLDDRPAYVQVMHDGELLVRTAPRRAQLSAGLPMVILVDEATASMGEVFASAIQTNHAGHIIGTATAGNVAAGEIFPLSDGAALQVTVFRLASAQGMPMNHVGVIPDERVERSPTDVRTGSDPQLAAARAYLAPLTRTGDKQAE